VSGVVEQDSLFEEVQMESVDIPEWKSRAVVDPWRHRSRPDLWRANSGATAMALRILNPSADELISRRDEVLTLGTPAQIREFQSLVARAAGDRGTQFEGQIGAKGMVGAQ